MLLDKINKSVYGSVRHLDWWVSKIILVSNPAYSRCYFFYCDIRAPLIEPPQRGRRDRKKCQPAPAPTEAARQQKVPTGTRLQTALP